MSVSLFLCWNGTLLYVKRPSDPTVSYAVLFLSSYSRELSNRLTLHQHHNSYQSNIAPWTANIDVTYVL